MCCTNDLCGTRRRVEWTLTPLLSLPLAVVDGPVGSPRMNLEMHLHLNSEFALKIRKILSGFALVRQCREQATVGRTYASMSVGGHALPPHPLILKWLHPPPPPPRPPHTHTTTTTTTAPLPHSSQVVLSAALFAGMKSENPRFFY